VTSAPTAVAQEGAPPPGPPALALVAAQALVTRYRLRLTDPDDTRLGELGGDRYVLGLAAWTGRLAAFVGFYEPPVADALGDLERRVRAAEGWATQRLTMQGVAGAEKAAVLLVALAPVAGGIAPQAAEPRVQVGAAAVDVTSSEVTTLAPLPRELPQAGQLRDYARAAQVPARVPTLAAVDLAERQTVQDGRGAPTRRALDTRPIATYGLIGACAFVFLLEELLKHRFNTPFGVNALAFYDAFGALANTGGAEWWRYVSSAFVHDAGVGGGVGILHILGNSLGLYLLGRPIEQLFGRLVLVATFLVTAVGGSLFWVACHSLGIAGPGIGYGASGGVFGLIGFILMLGRVQGRDLPVGVAHALRQYAMGLLVYNAVILLALGGALGINNFAHAGGLLTGVALGAWLPPRAAVGGRELRAWERGVLLAVVAGAGVALVAAGVHLHDALGQPVASPALNAQ
jgi:membrane associated rhomboid family serine protease